MSEIKNSKIFIFSIFVISIFIIFLMKYLCQNNSFPDDDFFFLRYFTDESYFDCLKFNIGHGNGSLGYFIFKFLSFGLPNLLSIHPNDYISNHFGIIKGIFTCLGLFIIAKFGVFYNKSKTIFVFLYLFLALYFFCESFSSHIIYVNYNYCRYFFTIIFYGYFLFFLYKQFIKEIDYNCNKKAYITQLLSACICGYAAGASNEINFFSSVSLIILLFLYNVFTKEKLSLGFILPVLCTVISTCCFVFEPGFKEITSERGMSNINITIEGIKEFSCLYFDIVFKQELIYWLIFIIFFIIASYFAIKKHKIKQIVFPSFLLFSILLVMYSLILCGKTFCDDFYWITHINVIFLYRMLIIIPLLINIDYSVKNIMELQRYKWVINGLICCCLAAGMFYYGLDVYKNAENMKNYNFKVKQAEYMCQKIMRFYSLNNEIPKIPECLVEKIPELRDEGVLKDRLIGAMVRIYKNKNYMDLGYEIIPGGYETFYKDGGIFYQYELEDIKFSRLFNDDFILNKKLTADFINNI